uniref:Peptidase S1 domain-containing protein n=1 Tax=Podarcis muralis TaxID=64176 RepID=A0A670JSD6_PODMU
LSPLVDVVSYFYLGQSADIIGGEESVPHSRPYMAALIIPVEGNTSLCGGTLIKRNWVLTAAHSIVFLGAHSLTGKQQQQRIKIIGRYGHPQYNEKTMENDIMLLKMEKSAKIDQHVKCIELPSTSNDVEAGTQCLVAGWGITDNKSRNISTMLREVNVTVIQRSVCNDENHYKHLMYVTSNMLCAGDDKGGKDACTFKNGDSGGPLICNGKQRGIVSFGAKSECGNQRYPGIYTLLTEDYLAWLREITEPFTG